MKFYFQRSAPALFLALALSALAHDVIAATAPFAAKPNQAAISRINSIATHESKWGTIVNVLGNGKISSHVTKTIESPPKIIVDIPCAADVLETIKFDVASPNLTALRIGYHLQKIRLVLDLKGTALPYFAARSADNELTIALRPNKPTASKGDRPLQIPVSKTTKKTTEQKELRLNRAPGPQNAQKATGQKDLPADTHSVPNNVTPATSPNDVSSDEVLKPKNIEKIPALYQPQPLPSDDVGQASAVVANENSNVTQVALGHPAPSIDTPATDEKETKYAFRILETVEDAGSEKALYLNNLMQLIPDDGREDTAFMIESLNAYKDQDWPRAIENLAHLIKTNPAGRYSERAHFLLAKTYEQQFSKSISDHFDEIKKYYEDASYKYPASEYLPEAFLGIGNLYFKIENYYDALAYYNLTIKKAKGSSLAASALLQKVKIMLQMGRKREAFSISAVLEDAVSRLPDIPIKTEAEILRAKILYEFNKYQESLNTLSGLLKENPHNIYQHPIISLYLGYNYYQLEDNKRSRENLLRFYNSRPDQEMNYLILAQIGDTYRNEGLTEQAVKFYQLVLKRYPDTEGAVISKIRLAELQEEHSLKVEKRIVQPFNILDEDMAMATDFYKEIINNPANRKNETPLTQLALLKLSIIHQKEGKYNKSLEYLKTLFVEYPNSKLRKEGRQALTETIKGLLQEDRSKKRYAKIMNFYLAEKDLFSIANAPELYLDVGRASIHQNFEDLGTEMFLRADPMLTDNEKPPDLLFLLGRHYYNQEKFKSALQRFGLLIERYPSDNNIPHAFRLKGDILFKQKQYAMADKMFSAALKYPLKKCQQLNLWIGKAKALAVSDADDKALEAAKKADGLKAACITYRDQIYREIGDLYFDLGDIQKAVAVFNQAIVITHDNADKIPLMLKVAECYWRLNKKEDFLALNEKISGLNDPFWSNLAKERMEEISFNWEMKKSEAASKKGEKI